MPNAAVREDDPALPAARAARASKAFAPVSAALDIIIVLGRLAQGAALCRSLHFERERSAEETAFETIIPRGMSPARIPGRGAPGTRQVVRYAPLAGHRDNVQRSDEGVELGGELVIAHLIGLRPRERLWCLHRPQH